MLLNSIILDILSILLLLLLFYKARIMKPLHLLNDDYLSVDTGKCYRGWFAIVVVFHHLASCTKSGTIFRVFTLVGYLAVAFFFFLSGYGVQKSYMTKEDNYKKHFLFKRISSVLIPYFIITIIYWLMYFIKGDFYSIKDIVTAIIDGEPIALYSWYIICIINFYIIYWLLMVICQKKYFCMILGGIIWYFLYAIFCSKMGYGIWYYNASQLLIVGMFWATYERKILKILKNNYIIIAPIIFAAFIVLFLFNENISSIIGMTYTSLILTLFTAILFVLSVLLISLKVKIGNKIFSFLGEISFEIYMSQGLFIKILRSNLIYIKNDFLWCLAVLSGTIIFSYFLHKMFQFIMEKYKIIFIKKYTL